LFEDAGRLPLSDGELECAPELLAKPFEPEPAHGGRSERPERVAGAELFSGALLAGPFDRPKPWGARPRSVVLPWASQLRAPLVRLLIVPPAVDGLFCESWFWRVDIAELAGRPAESALVLIVRTGI
jgi:hypothetical protein